VDDERDNDDVAGVAALADPVRRRLYDLVAASVEPVSRDQAAEAAGIKRALAAFHLDKLVEEGLIDVEFRRLSGRSGPGAGRPAKLYRRSLREFGVTLPPREYDLVGGILAEGIERAALTGTDVVTAVQEVARQRGEALARSSDAGSEGSVAILVDVLRKHGFEPRDVQGGRLELANCPFHALAQDHTQLVCGVNLALCRGLCEAAGVQDLVPRLEPRPGRCCVTFRDAAS